MDEYGWLHTGDAARLDSEGFWIVDRLRDGYDTAAGRVFPSDVDRVLWEFPGVADAASVGIPGAGGIATAFSFVVRDAGQAVDATLLIGWCRERLPTAAAPKAIRFLEAIPRNSVGKVLRERLKEMAAE